MDRNHHERKAETQKEIVKKNSLKMEKWIIIVDAAAYNRMTILHRMTIQLEFDVQHTKNNWKYEETYYNGPDTFDEPFASE